MTPLLLVLAATAHISLGQLQFSGNKNQQDSDNNNPDVGEKFFLGEGNEFLNGALLGAAGGGLAGVIGSQFLGGNNNNYGGQCYTCCNNNIFGRKKRQANDPDQKLFFGNNNNCCSACCYNGRRKRQANEENPDTKLFGLFGNNNNNQCGYRSCHNNFNNQNNFSSRCQCDYSLSKRDNYGQEEAKCRKPDQNDPQRRYWCYTTSSSNCRDAQRSSRYPRNPWSYRACNN